jgi:hypothetical protein
MSPMAITGETGTASIARTGGESKRSGKSRFGQLDPDPSGHETPPSGWSLSLGNKLCVPEHSLRKATACRWAGLPSSDCLEG